MHAANEGFMKALLEDVRTTTNHMTTFRGPTGNRWRLRLDAVTGELTVEVAPPYSTRPPPPPSAPPGED